MRVISSNASNHLNEVNMLAPMLAHIDQECDEKIEEIDVRADEEAKKEIKKIVNDQCDKINQHYKNKHRTVSG